MHWETHWYDKFIQLVSTTEDQYIKRVVFLYVCTGHAKQEFRTIQNTLRKIIFELNLIKEAKDFYNENFSTQQ